MPNPTTPPSPTSSRARSAGAARSRRSASAPSSSPPDRSSRPRPTAPPGATATGAAGARPSSRSSRTSSTSSWSPPATPTAWSCGGGDPVEDGAPPFDVDAQTPDAQAKQFGYNCDFIGWLPLGERKALLVVNHEYTDEQLMFAGVADEEGAGDIPDEQKRIAVMVHGISVVQVHRVGRTGEWRATPERDRNRRITTETTFHLTGPAAGSEYLRTSAHPEGRTVLGTLNNCAGGVTPWGTTLHGEENFNQYFGTTAPISDATQLAALRRYGVGPEDVPTRRWHTVDPRFDLSKEPNEVNRFGWVVEVDPYDPTSTPRKHTALGRFKHEGADVQIATDGRVVAYSGDDERFDYIYKFVSGKKYREGHDRATRQHNMTLLEDGDLYVARFTGDSRPRRSTGAVACPRTASSTAPASGSRWSSTASR
ncbi:alkaline phosphatase PhoX [Blastococcus sp. HT6-30]|uniref:PhoX family protein n=1 Tax=Blastococcus sp. HT6-30 TaxID=3144843 RepID=UPI00321ABA06